MNYLEEYAVFSGGNEAPPIYHKWAGICTLSNFVSRRVWVEQGFFTVYPNLYVIFVGNPGNGKSTAMKIARDLVRTFDPDDCPIVPSSITRESLTKDMGDSGGKYLKSYEWGGEQLAYTPANIFANEIVTLLGKDPIGMIELFTDIWDEDKFEVNTKNAGKDSIPKPAVNICGCMTPEITGNLLKENIISGGFARRCIFVYGRRRGSPVPIPTITQEQVIARDKCLQWGKKLTKIVGEFEWEPTARELFIEWYKKNYDFVQNNSDVWLNGYYTSKNTLVLKVAALLALSESLTLTLKDVHIQQALDLLGETEQDMGKVFAGTGRNAEANLAQRITTMVNSSPDGIVREKKIMSVLYDHGTYDEIQRAIQHLINIEEITHVLKGGVRYLRKYATDPSTELSVPVSEDSEPPGSIQVPGGSIVI